MLRDRRLLILLLVILSNLIGFGIIIPFLPLYATRLGASPWQVGWLFASYSIAQMVAAPFLGELSDRYGRRPILMASLWTTTLSFVILALADRLWMLFAARIIDGLGGANIPTVRAYIGDVTEPQDRARAYGLLGASFGVALVLGPALSGLLAHWGPAVPAWGAAVLSGVALGATWLWLPETVHRASARTAYTWADFRQVLRQPVVGYLLITDFLYWNASTAYQTTFPLFGQARFHLNVSQVGYLFALIGALGILMQLYLVGPIVRRIGERAALTYGFVLMGLGLVGIGFTHRLGSFVAWIFPTALGASLGLPSLIALISQAGTSENQGRIQGVASSLESLARIAGPVWGNGLFQWVGPGAPYVSAGLLMLATGAWAGYGLAVRLGGAGRRVVRPAGE
ncbi:Tetracycline resistance protein, class C [bacterium HR11]|nr:Tetracycline resistance protein, class C [bacterium HR11]